MRTKPRSGCRLVRPGSQEQKALCARPRGDAYYAILADREHRREAWAECRHIKSVERILREQQEAQREREKVHRSFRVKRHKNWEDVTIGVKAHAARLILPTRMPGALMPRYSNPIIDTKGRLFVFQRIRYYSSLKTKQGHCRDRASYGMDGAHVFPGGTLAVDSNMGETRGEILECVDFVELVNRTAARNAKTFFHGIMQSCHELSPEQQFEMAKAYAEETFGGQGLPYLVCLHPPSAEGDQRNWHVHLFFSFRPVTRVNEGEWEIGRHLRTDLDAPTQFKRLRALWAAELNFACEKAGLERRYTHLSYAAAGVDWVPQKHLGEGLTAKVRRGEHVALNLANHRIAARNALKRATQAFRAELMSRVSKTREAVEAALNAAVMAQAVRSAMPAQSPDWALRTAAVEQAPIASPNGNASASKPAPWTIGSALVSKLQESSAPRPSPRPFALKAKAPAAQLPSAATLPPRPTPFALRVTLPSTAIPTAPAPWPCPQPFVLPSVSHSLHPPAAPAPRPRSKPFTLLAKPPAQHLPAAPAPRPAPKPFRLSAAIAAALPSAAPQMHAAIKARLGLGANPIAPPSKQAPWSPRNLSALKSRPVVTFGAATRALTQSQAGPAASSSSGNPPSVSGFLAAPAHAAGSRPWLREPARATLLKDLQERAVYVERVDTGQVLPVLMERGLYQFSRADLADPGMQAHLAHMYQRQQAFLSRFNPIAANRIGESDLNRSNKAMIAKLPDDLQSEAEAWAKTALWDKIMRDLREHGLRRSRQSVEAWRTALRTSDRRRFELAANASDQNRLWPIEEYDQVSQALERDASVHRQRLGIYQAAQSGGGSSAPVSAVSSRNSNATDKGSAAPSGPTEQDATLTDPRTGLNHDANRGRSPLPPPQDDKGL